MQISVETTRSNIDVPGHVAGSVYHKICIADLPGCGLQGLPVWFEAGNTDWPCFGNAQPNSNQKWSSRRSRLRTLNPQGPQAPRASDPLPLSLETRFLDSIMLLASFLMPPAGMQQLAYLLLPANPPRVQSTSLSIPYIPPKA